MKFDLHCHIKHGSIDARVEIEDYINLLMAQGFDGMLITDHDSYNGYRQWKKLRAATRAYDEFVVLKGVEYDTCDAGHILVIMPEGMKLKILEIRGLPLAMLINIVHKYDGILGPAHPYGSKFLSVMGAKKLERNPHLIEEFDFIEAFNTCESTESNESARAMAEAYGKPMFGGSDAHQSACVGMAYTNIDYPIRDNNDFIDAVKLGRVTSCGGRERIKRKRNDVSKSMPLGIAFKVYNRGVGALKHHKREKKIRGIFGK